jgi:inner membrane protein
MDIVTQGLLGAALAQAAAPPSQTRAATVVGFCAGVLPDADALLRSSADPLLFLDWHRHFTHALAFVPAGALIASILLAPFYLRRLGAARLYGYAFLGYALSGLLDACTSYGTHLWWPFSDERVAWSIISIVDPVFSGILLVGVIVVLWKTRASAARIALVLCGIYLAFGLSQHDRALAIAHALAGERGHAPARLLVKPTFANLILWRSLYIVDDEVYADAVRIVPFAEHQLYQGEHQKLVGSSSLGDWGGTNTLARTDFERFARFADGFVVRHPSRPQLLGDARFALLPNSLQPVWGIEAPAGETGHARFVTAREFTPVMRSRFLAMLLGRG